MFTKDVSSSVGSATDHLSATSSSILTQYKSFSLRQNCDENEHSQAVDTDYNGFQFDLIKINCKKEHSNVPKKQLSFQRKLKYKLLKQINRVKWIFYALVLLVCLSVIAYSVYRLVEISLFKMESHHRIFKRELHDRSNLRWSGIETPSIYEIDPFLFGDSANYTGFNAIKSKLDYLQRSLKVNTILLKNLQRNYEKNTIDKLEHFETHLGSEQDLNELITELHLRSMKIAIELEITSTSVDSQLFKSKLVDYYLTNLTSNDEKWFFNEEKRVFYFGNGDKSKAYFNYDLDKPRQYLYGAIDFWCSTFKLDAIYLKDIDNLKIVQDIEPFVFQLRRRCNSLGEKITVRKTQLIGDFSASNESLNHLLLDIYLLNLNAQQVFNQIESNYKLSKNQNPFDYYLIHTSKKLIWSLHNFQGLRSHLSKEISDKELLTTFYLIIYSLPGTVIIRQGHESSCLLDSCRFKQLSMNDSNEILTFMKLFNERIKPKLYDRLEESKQTFTTTKSSVTINNRPEPFANSFKSISKHLYLKDSFYSIDFQHGILKFARQIDLDQRRRFELFSLSAKFYRNILFFINYSNNDYYLENLIKSSDLGVEYSRDSISISIHILYDSTNNLTSSYLHLNSPYSFDSSVKLKSKQLLVLEI